MTFAPAACERVKFQALVAAAVVAAGWLDTGVVVVAGAIAHIPYQHGFRSDWRWTQITAPIAETFASQFSPEHSDAAVAASDVPVFRIS